MHLEILVHSDMRQLPVPEQLFSYAEGYRGSAAVLCEKMKSDLVSFTWPNGAVVLLLASHAVELFLKGALLKGNPTANVWDHNHNIDLLGADYRSQFPDPLFKWDIPFTDGLTETERIAQMKALYPSLTEVEIAELKALRDRTPNPSILYRYPVAKGGKQWRGLYGFEPHSFVLLLDQLKTDFDRIKSHLT